MESEAPNLTATSNEESQNEGSVQVSPTRGFSSDDGSGWKSETTETSEGNLSLSQYPLEGQDCDIAANDGEKHAFLSSAISEVSRDFISGNFSPSKYPGGSGESDSMSDGDHHLEPHQSGAVYARYPESATGLSDCEWNPYATESDNNHTPRSSASANSPTNLGITSCTSVGGATLTASLDRNNSAPIKESSDKKSPPPHQAERGDGVRSIFDEEYRLALQQPVSSYVLYPSDARSSSTDTDAVNRLDGRSIAGSEAPFSSSGTGESFHSQQSHKSLAENQYIPSLHREITPRVSSSSPVQSARQTKEGINPPWHPSQSKSITEERRMLVKSGSDSDETDMRRRPDPIGEMSNKPGIAVPRLTTTSDSYQPKQTEIPVKDVTSRDPVRVTARADEEVKLQSEKAYLPIDERNKLLGYTPSLEPSSIVVPENLSHSLSADVNGDALSSRVAKLLTDANQLGSNLHQSLYDRQALGLTHKEDFPKYKFSPVKSGLTTPSPTFSGAEPIGPEDHQRVKTQIGDDLTGSLRSSLGEEVAKLMAKTENVSTKSKEQKQGSTATVSTSFRPISVDKKNSDNSLDENLRKYYSQRKEKKGEKDQHSRHGSEESRESLDSLDQRVKDILQKTSYVDKMQAPMASKGIESEGDKPASLDYSLLQRDLQEIQSSLDHQMYPMEKSDADKTSDTNALLESFKFGSEGSESTRSGGRKLLWDHAGDLGIEDSATGYFVGNNKSDTETDLSLKTGVTSPGHRESYSLAGSGKMSQKLDSDLPTPEKNDSTVSDVVSERGHVAADVEEIIARYQGQSQTEPKVPVMEPRHQVDTSGLANRVFKILTQEPPEKQATGILEKAMQQEREMLLKMTDRLDGSYALESADNSFVPRDQDVRRQLEWSEMSSLNLDQPDKTGISEMSFKKVTDAPFSALGNAKTFLSSQLQKTSEKTFNHSIELHTPYRRAIECYPVYGVERKPTDGATSREKDRKEAWPDERTARNRERERIVSQNPLASERFFLNALDTSPTLPQRRYSDPRDLSPEGRIIPERDGHCRSKSEETRDLRSDYEMSHHRIEPEVSLTDRRVSSSPLSYAHDNLLRRGETDPSLSGSTGRRETIDTTPPDTSPRGGSPGDSDGSTSRRSGSGKLRPYRPAGSKELYYTESADETTSIADSITTAESTHTGSDDAIGPYFPKQHLGSRIDVTPSPGIYGNKKSTDDGLSTIDERSVSDDREMKAERVSSQGSNPGLDIDRRDSGLELSSKTSYDRIERPLSTGSERQSDRSVGSSKGYERSLGRDRSGPSIPDESHLSQTTRSDPGDFATPKRRRNEDLTTSSDHHVQSHLEESLRRETMPKSRSETDLLTLGPEVPHKSSSPLHGTRLMDLSAQPSPIFSLHSSINTPTVPAVKRYEETGRKYNETGRERRTEEPPLQAGGGRRSEEHLSQVDGSRRYGESLSQEIRAYEKPHDEVMEEQRYEEDKYVENRVRQMPLEVGNDYVQAVTKLKGDSDSRLPEKIEYSRPWDTLSNQLPRKSIEYKPAEKNAADSYYPARAREYQRTIDMGRELLQERPPDPKADYYVVDKPLEKGKDFQKMTEYREYHRPLEKGPDYDATERTLEKGPDYDATERTLEKGPDYDVTEGRSSEGYSHSVRPVYDITTRKSTENLKSLSKESVHERSRDRSCEISTEKLQGALYEEDKRGEKAPRYIENERGRPLDRGADYLDMFILRALEDPEHTGIVQGQRSRSRSQERRSRSRSPHVNLSNDSTLQQYTIDGEIFTELPKVPDDDFEEMVKSERLKVKQELEMIKMLKKKGKMLTEEELKEFGAEYDCIPPSKRAQSLREKLEKESARSLPSNINDMWNRFQEMNDSQSDSSMNTSRIETLTHLLRNPTRHFVQKALDEKTYQKVKEKRVTEELAALERQQRRDIVDGRREELAKLRKQLRDEESNGSYTETLALKEKKSRILDRDVSRQQAVDRDKTKKEKENINKGSKSEAKKLGDSADTLYSIAEDTSFEGSRRSSPNINEVKHADRPTKTKQKRQRHVIDPLMSKLKDKVQRQRDKIDKERRKEMKRMEKLKKLEMLLTAKKKGCLTDKAIDVELENVSTTSVAISDESSTFMDSTGRSDLSSDTATINNTSSKDSSIEFQKVRVRKPRMTNDKESYKSTVLPEDSESQSDIVVVRKPRKSKSDKHGANKAAKASGKSSADGREGRYRYSPNQGQDRKYQSVSPSREKFRQETSPVGRKLIRDVGTMYPSPIVVSPATHRSRSRKVCMKSEAVQTDRRQYSPTHSETRVIPVPLMSPENKRKSRSASPSSVSASDRVRSSVYKSSSRSRSPQPRLRNLSPDSSANKSGMFSRSYSPPRSPSTRSRSKESRTRSKSPKSRMFVPESESEYEKYVISTPPKNRMFTPETPTDEYEGKVRDSPRGLAWYIPMGKDVKPWKKTLKEQQAHAVSKEPWQPKSIDARTWKNMVNADILNTSRGKNTQFDLDPAGHPLEKTFDQDSDQENVDPKPKIRTKMSLQEAFQIYKQDTISHLRARQKRVSLASEERKLQKLLEKERNELFAEQRKKEANPEAHPYSENLHVPKKRVISKQEMKELTNKFYKNLPEVVEQKKLKKRNEDYELNRLKARVFNRKIQKKVLKK